MPDTFDRLGVFGVARASRLQRVRRRHAAASPEPASERSDAGRCASLGADSPERCSRDVAIDFVDMTAFVGRMQSAFFSGQS